MGAEKKRPQDRWNEKAGLISKSYNQLEITEESITTMKAADERVQRTFSNLTPAAVRELIRQGNNPLDMPLEELNATVESIQKEGWRFPNGKLSF